MAVVFGPRSTETAAIIQYARVSSHSLHGRSYVVSQMTDGSFQCSCLGWTRHVPRVDCKHILTAREGLGVPIDPLIHAIGKAQRRAAKKGVAS